MLRMRLDEARAARTRPKTKIDMSLPGLGSDPGGGSDPGAGGGLPLAHPTWIQVVFNSVYLSIACSDLSRPLPDCL
jgi:hypothetical protein